MKPAKKNSANIPSTLAVFLVSAAGMLLTHLSLLRLPYFWDEAGYYIPAARDLYQTGALIPHSTITNAHPPLVMAYLALDWKIFGYSPLVTRSAMLLIAAFALSGVFELARRVATLGVAIASTISVAAYPVFFAQASLAHLDLAAGALTIWGLLFYIERRFALAALWFALAALAKETAIIAPLALLVWELVAPSSFRLGRQRMEEEPVLSTAEREPVPGLAHNRMEAGRDPSREERALGMTREETSTRGTFWLSLPLLPLTAWFAFHFARTGHIFGNPEFFRYNVAATMQPLRILFAALRRAWQLVGYMNLFVLTIATALAMFFPAQQDATRDGRERRRIAIPVQLVFAVVIAAYWLVMSIVGGAALARYLLPAIPLVIILCVSTLRRRVRGWPMVIVLVAATFVLGLFVNPPYVFAPEDNLAYRDYVELHQQAADFLQARHPTAGVLTAWPASDELSKPWLGYVRSSFKILQLENFTREELQAAMQNQSFDFALVFSTKYQPPRPLWMPAFWRRAQTRFFGYHTDVQPFEAAQILGGRVIYEQRRAGQWVAVIEMPEVREARATTETQRRGEVKLAIRNQR